MVPLTPALPMRTTLFLTLLALVAVGCSTGRTNVDNDLAGTLVLEQSELSPNNTIVENAMGQPELEMLVAAVQRADLTGALSGDGPYTVFAPIDAAWEDMDLSAMDPDELANVLQYHVIEGDFESSQLSDGMTLEALDGNDLTISTRATGDPDFMVDDADIVYPDIESSNGTIHLINLVLDPTRGGLAR